MIGAGGAFCMAIAGGAGRPMLPQDQDIDILRGDLDRKS
jgi:hypothetical protein